MTDQEKKEIFEKTGWTIKEYELDTKDELIAALKREVEYLKSLVESYQR